MGVTKNAVFLRLYTIVGRINLSGVMVAKKRLVDQAVAHRRSVCIG